MQIDRPTVLLGGLTPAAFMRRHWQKEPLLVRGALPDAQPLLSRSALFALAARDDVESRLVVKSGERWTLRDGPLPRRALPPLKTPGWTLLVQGVDLHLQAAHELMARFRFVPDARLDDLMVSFASDGGGVGPHLDSYDVFLIQLEGRRRWRIGRPRDAAFVDGLPLKILRRFEPEQEWVLDAGDMLYLPPRWAHQGTAVGACLTASVGFRAPQADELVRELLPRLADGRERVGAERRYADAQQPATANPGTMPPALVAFAGRALERALRQPQAIERALGEWLSEPKPQVWFDPPAAAAGAERGVAPDRRTRMLYDARHLFVNGEALRLRGRDAALLRALADRRRLDAGEVARLSPQARAIVDDWIAAGWLRAEPA